MTIIFDFVTSMKLCIVLKLWIAKFRIILKLCIMSIIFDFVMPMKLWITFLEVWVIFEALVYFEGLDCEVCDYFCFVLPRTQILVCGATEILLCGERKLFLCGAGTRKSLISQGDLG